LNHQISEDNILSFFVDKKRKGELGKNMGDERSISNGLNIFLS